MTKEPLDFFYSKDGLASLENYPGETMRALFRASRLDRIAARGRTLLDFVVRCIWWVLCLLVTVFASIQLISWAMAPRGCEANSTGVLVWDSDLGPWEVKELFLCPPQPSKNSKD